MAKCYVCNEPTKGRKFCKGHKKLWERWEREKKEEKKEEKNDNNIICNKVYMLK